MTKRRTVVPLLKMKPPRLTTRRRDAFTDDEFQLLSIANKQNSVWIALTDGTTKLFVAVHALQRLGYLAPKAGGTAPDGVRGRGWKITEDGRDALTEALRRKAA